MPKHTIGLDVGGTKIQAGVITRTGRVIDSVQFANDISTTRRTLAQIMAAIDHFFRTHTIGGIGVGITGVVESAAGVVVSSPNLPRDWHRIPLGRLLKNKYHVPISIDNDANCCALAEALIGRGKRYSVVLGLTIGTGIGTGLVIDKKLYRGGLQAVEFGHTVISDSQVRCSCGRPGHFEALVSGTALVAAYRRQTGTTKTSYQIIAEARAGKRAARQTLHTMSGYLARGLANATQAYSPDIIVLGGGLARVSALVKPALKKVPTLVRAVQTRRPHIVTSRLHYDAGIIGAALLAHQPR
ncbi:MAG: ROK family protein [Patescibacteria group bacterium]